MRTSEKFDLIAAAMIKVQAKIKPAKKDATNPHFKSSYANLAAIVEASRDILIENGIAVIQGARVQPDGTWVLTTRLQHSSTQFFESDFPLSTKDGTMQAYGSATTYAKRYSMLAMIGLVDEEEPEDDDGERSQGRRHDNKNKQSKPSQGKEPPKVAPQEMSPVAAMIKTVMHVLKIDQKAAVEYAQMIVPKASKDFTAVDIAKVQAAAYARGQAKPADPETAQEPSEFDAFQS